MAFVGITANAGCPDGHMECNDGTTQVVHTHFSPLYQSCRTVESSLDEATNACTKDHGGYRGIHWS